MSHVLSPNVGDIVQLRDVEATFYVVNSMRINENKRHIHLKRWYPSGKISTQDSIIFSQTPCRSLIVTETSTGEEYTIRDTMNKLSRCFVSAGWNCCKLLSSVVEDSLVLKISLAISYKYTSAYFQQLFMRGAYNNLSDSVDIFRSVPVSRPPLKTYLVVNTPGGFFFLRLARAGYDHEGIVITMIECDVFNNARVSDIDIVSEMFISKHKIPVFMSMRHNVVLPVYYIRSDNSYTLAYRKGVNDSRVLATALEDTLWKYSEKLVQFIVLLAYGDVHNEEQLGYLQGLLSPFNVFPDNQPINAVLICKTIREIQRR